MAVTVTDQQFRRVWFGVGSGKAEALRIRNTARSAIRSVLHHLTPDEVDSLAMIAVWKSIQSFKPEYKTAFYRTVYRQARWHAMRERRKLLMRGKRQSLSITDPSIEDTDQVEWGLSQLNRLEQDIVRAHMNGDSFQLISETLQMPKTTIWRHYKKALQILKTLLEEKYD